MAEGGVDLEIGPWPNGPEPKIGAHPPQVSVFGPIFLKMCKCIFLGVPGHFFKENDFMDRVPRGIQKPTWELPNPSDTRVMAA